MPAAQHAPTRNSRTLRVLVRLLRLVFWPVMDLRIVNGPPAGLEHGSVMVGNHRSFIDFVAGAIAAIKYNVPMRFLLAYEYTEMPVVGPILLNCGAIPVYRGDDQRKGGALIAAEEALKDGKAVVIMPEGSRLTYNDDDVTEMGRLHTGAARLAGQNNVPIMVVGMAGAERAWPRYHWPRFFRREKVVFYIHDQLFYCDPKLAARPNTQRLREAMTEAIIIAEGILADWKTSGQLPPSTYKSLGH